jgi:hypothetical protein
MIYYLFDLEYRFIKFLEPIEHTGRDKRKKITVDDFNLARFSSLNNILS